MRSVPRHGGIVPLIDADAGVLVSGMRQVRAAGAVPLLGDTHGEASPGALGVAAASIGGGMGIAAVFEVAR